MLSLLSRRGELSVASARAARVKGSEWLPVFGGNLGGTAVLYCFVQAVPSVNTRLGRPFCLPRQQPKQEGKSMKELEKLYDPARVEDDIYAFWLNGGYFHTKADKS